MSTAVHGKAAVVKLDVSGGTLTDITNYVESVEFNPAISDHITTTLGQSSESSIVGIKNGAFTVNFVYDRAAWTHITGIYGASASKTFNISPEGTGTGTPIVSGECNLLSFTMPVSVNDALKFSAQFKTTGDVTFGTNS